MAVGTAMGSVLALGELLTGFGGSSIGWVPEIAVGILVAGSVGGWLFGPGAMMARGRGGWFGVVAGLGLVAVPIGDIATVGTAVALAAAAGTNDPITLLTAGPIYVVLGLIVVGPFALPCTLGAAAVWAAIMYRLRPQASTPSPVSA